MNRILKTAILSTGIAATILATLPAANADDWRWRRHHHNHNDALAAGVVGLAAGALIAGALSNPQPRYNSYYEPGYDDYDYRYVQPAPVRRYYAQPRVVYADRYAEPWTRAWYEYCSDRYRTFNSRTGTFTGNDGEQHFCVAN
ncbi:MAG: BA14K family protein [Mesorhizobium sp.]|uniref:BA14K family protein n=1 Tax=Mesorhizobium TaxID=68287 RepID=UPI000F75BF41|nr:MULTISPECIES: BA14K family protein [unclassified Mesorhizobium]RVC56333.1 BA14K family protein [Mesorhizobium sp. M4B.F.Ca.ET.088.02.2.1]RVD73744.1 BA14K family protein [Mesorhizobium sp. M4A.F.Ca.ET.029.04.2.1]AZO51388.1 BA14K family protein [Mesorhizobium sp. M4B.F.Ca.ET.058.02.1.1]RUX36618.1 BA14K family protein [Mesorhizobium sp. M4A.F.Ca.ET.050.02.1.1]RVC40054.1 BA14K family protein [Mesorhizobium sp. M4A.F.Ca.ET.090.04.2.1]